MTDTWTAEALAKEAEFLQELTALTKKYGVAISVYEPFYLYNLEEGDDGQYDDRGRGDHEFEWTSSLRRPGETTPPADPDLA